jgi:hypothetical protein
MRVSLRAFGTDQSVSLGRTDERAWTPLAPATGTTATTATIANPATITPANSQHQPISQSRAPAKPQIKLPSIIKSHSVLISIHDAYTAK